MEKKIKAALFDLDGVVFDTEPQYTKFWGMQCKKYHPEYPGLEYKIKGQTLTQIYDQWFNGPLLQEREKITQQLNLFEEQMDFIFVPGFEAFIAELRSKGVKTAVVTSSNKKKMESVYRAHTHFILLFDAILTSEDFSESKPSPDCYLKASKRLGVAVDECVVFEDSINGLRSGRAAEMLVVGLTTTNTAEVIKDYSDYQISDYTSTDLLNWESAL